MRIFSFLLIEAEEHRNKASERFQGFHIDFQGDMREEQQVIGKLFRIHDDCRILNLFASYTSLNESLPHFCSTQQ